MRSIIFRGKRVDNGEWVYGGYTETDTYNLVKGKKCFIVGKKVCDSTIDTFYDVIPETVGQFTGLSDKNGKKIFEGDICSCFCDTQIFVVKYCQDRCGYFFDDCVLGGGCEPQPECLGNLRNTIEVIGNIHDNKELLEVEE